MFKKLLMRRLLGRLPQIFLVFLFQVGEAKTRREKRTFHKIWTSVWVEEGYAHKDEPLPQIEAHYALFDEFSTDFLLKFLGVFPIGTLRLIWESEMGLPVLNDFKVTRTWEDSVVEFTLLTLKRKWRGLGIPPLLLWREGYRRARQEGVGIVMAADERLWRALIRLFPFRQIGPSKFYEGSITYPAFLDFKEAERVLREENPKLYKFFV